MGVYTECEYDPSYEPGPKEINTLRGIIVGEIDGHDWGSPGRSSEYTCSADWAFENIPILRASFNRLMPAGFVFEYAWFEGDYSIGLTEAGMKWCIQHLGLPAGRPRDHADQIRQTIGAAFIRKGEEIKIASTSTPKGVRETSEWVTQTSYTEEEAAAEKDRIAAAKKAGSLNSVSARAYNAHVTRRTAKAA